MPLVNPSLLDRLLAHFFDVWAPPARWRAAKNELPVAVMIQASSLITPHIVRNHDGSYMVIVRLDAPVIFETADPENVLERHETKIHWLDSLDGVEGQFGLTEHCVQRFTRGTLPPVPGDRYPAEFDRAYRAYLELEPALVREHYITLIFWPAGAIAGSRRSAEEIVRGHAAAVQALKERIAALLAMLEPFKPVLLGDYERDGVTFSQVIEFLAMLVNGRWQPMRSTREPLGPVLPTVRPSARRGVVELHGIGSTRYAAMLDVREYKDVAPGVFNAPLYEQVEWVQTLGGIVLDRTTAEDVLKLQQAHLTSAEDVSEQQHELQEARKEAANGNVKILEFHYGMAVFGDTEEAARQAASRIASAVARTTGIQMVPVDLLPDAAWWAQLPGNFRWRPRRANITSRAFAAMAATHGFSPGKQSGNPWGDPVAEFPTDSGQPFRLSLHESPPGENNEGQKWPGTTGILGSNGGGKTAVQMAIAMQSQRWCPAPRIVTLDKDRSCEIAVRCLGGDYFRPQVGLPTGINPLQLEPSPEAVAFWNDFVLALAHDSTLPYLPVEKEHVAHAVNMVARMPRFMRTLTTIRQNLPTSGPQSPGNNVWDRIGRWCCGGANGWVFDMAPNRLPAPEEVRVIGLDYTQFFDLPEVRGPLLMALMHYFERIIESTGRLICVLAELWRAIQDPHIAAFARNQIKTIRKKGGLLLYDTQEPQDILTSAIGASLVSQTSTFILLPDNKARPEDYIDGFRLTPRQFDILRRRISRGGGHRFLVVQGDQSAVCNFDLSGMQEHLLVLSSDKDRVLMLDQIRAEVGDDPRVWLPILRERALGKSRSQHLRRAA